jgi:hypothetical protein
MVSLYFCFFTQTGKRFRMTGWMYLVTLLLFVFVKGRWYYMRPGYDMLYAAGAVWGESWLASTSRGKAMAVRTAVWALLVLEILYTVTIWW